MGEAADAMVERIFLGAVTALEMLSVALGDRLGLYATLRDGGPLTAEALPSEPGSTLVTPASGWSNRPQRAF